MNTHSYKFREDKYFRTTSFYAAAFLCAKGLQLIDIDRANLRRCQFVFQDTPEREELLRIFNFAKEGSPEAKIDARKFVMVIKMLKDKLYQGGRYDQ